ncbi:MAG: sugar phosphate isomerase/epimerase [Gaiellales bacterium]
MRVGLFTDGLAHLGRREAIAWCAERGIHDLEMGVGTWSPRPHLELASLLTERGERDRLAAELREHGSRLSCVNAAGNPLHPADGPRKEAQDALRGAIELATLMGVDTVVTMSGTPGGRKPGGDTGIFAVSWITPDDEPLWEWQFRERVVPYWRELSTWAELAAPGVRICLELHPGLTIFGNESFRRLRAEVGENVGINLDPSHFWWQGVDPLTVIEQHGDSIGFAHGKDTLLYPERIRTHGMLDARYPIDPEAASWHFVAVGDGRPQDEWRGLLDALRASGYDGVVSIEHEDPRMTPEASIEASAKALRQALA